MANAPLNKLDAIHSMAPAYEFRTTVDTTRFTKAIYYAPSSGTSFTVHDEIANANVTFYAEGFILPVRTKTAVTITGYSVVYLY